MLTSRTAQRLLVASMALAGLSVLAGCGALVVGGAAATTATVATDRRTTGEQVEDQAIELKVSAEMRRLFGDRARVHVTSYAGLVLLAGDVPTENDRRQAEAAAARVEKVKRVVNELRVGPLTPLSVRTNDTWLTSKVKTNLINTKQVPSRTITVTTERGVVYLLGKVTDTEAQMAAKVASGVAGVNKVVKLFHIVSAASLAERPSPAPVQEGSTATTPEAPSAGMPGTGQSLDGAQTLPVQ